MKVLTIFLLFITFVVGFPVSGPIAGDILDSDPLVPRPIGDRPIDGRPVDGRPIEPRPIQFTPPIGSHALNARQSTVPNAYIIEFKEGYTHEMFYAWTKAQNIIYDVRVVYNYTLLKGISVQFKNVGDVDKTRNWEGTLNFWPVQVVTIPPCEEGC